MIDMTHNPNNKECYYQPHECWESTMYLLACLHVHCTCPPIEQEKIDGVCWCGGRKGVHKRSVCSLTEKIDEMDWEEQIDGMSMSELGEDMETLKDFIRTLLTKAHQEEREAIRKMVEGMREEGKFGSTYGDTGLDNPTVVYGINSVITDILSALDKRV